eukprot:7589-Heterococcus_DN1.PRE.1
MPPIALAVSHTQPWSLSNIALIKAAPKHSAYSRTQHTAAAAVLPLAVNGDSSRSSLVGVVGGQCCEAVSDAC